LEQFATIITVGTIWNDCNGLKRLKRLELSAVVSKEHRGIASTEIIWVLIDQFKVKIPAKTM